MKDRNEKRREARGGYVCSFRIQGLERATLPRITNHHKSNHGPRHKKQSGLTTALQGGWFPLYDTIGGVRGELGLSIKLPVHQTQFHAGIRTHFETHLQAHGSVYVTYGST